MHFTLSTKQKQILVVVLALVLILGITCCSKDEPTAEFDPMGTVAADNLNVRKKADPDSKILGRLPVDLKIEILEQKVVDGITWGLGTALSYIAAGKAGAAISYALGQGAPMIAALWGIFVWREFKGAPRSVGWLLMLMFIFFLSGLGAIIISGAN